MSEITDLMNQPDYVPAPDLRDATIVRLLATLVMAREGLDGMIAEWEKMTQYGSPLAKGANEQLGRARFALAQVDAALKEGKQ
jgi:hypothetical protein